MTEFEAAQRESSDEGPVVEVAGRSLRLPAALPPGLAAAVQMQRFDAMYKMVARNASFVEDEECDCGCDSEVLLHLMMNLGPEDWDGDGVLAVAYGVSTGESSASDNS